MDNVLKAIEDNKIEETIKKADVWKWYQDTDLKALREQFGYNSQTGLAEKLGLNVSTICRFEKKDEKITKTTDSLIRIYDFFNNDFNINIEENKSSRGKRKQNIDDEIEFFKDFDLKNYVETNYVSITDFLKDVGYKNIGGQQIKTVKKLINKDFTKLINGQVIKIYEFLKEKDNDHTLTTTFNENGLQVHNVLGVEVMSICKNPKITIDNTYIKDEEPKEITVNKEQIETHIPIYLEDRLEVLTAENNKLKQENCELKQQIRRYEKLIDRM